MRALIMFCLLLGASTVTPVIMAQDAKPTADKTSGAPDATLMTQTHDAKAAAKANAQTKKHGDAKGGRPATTVDKPASQ